MRVHERSQRVEAVVLRHSDYGEADRLLTVFSREAGKLRIIAKGVRRMKSRKAGHLEPFTRAALMLAYGRDLWIVTQADTVDAYQPMREDLLRTGYAAYIVELLDRFTYEEGENRALYALLIQTLERIAHEADPFAAVRFYEIRLLDLLGFRPELQRCLGCSQDIQPEDQFFSAERGGVFCPRCRFRDLAARPVSVAVVKALRHFQRSSYSEALRLPLPPALRSEMESLLQYYLTYHLERSLNSPAFLRRVRSQNASTDQSQSTPS